jgi:hypothetical protein
LKAATFIRSQLYDQSRRVLFRNYRGGRSHVEGFADDYAFVIQGLLDLYEACFDVNLLQFAIRLQETQDRLFFDQEHGGYFSGTGEDPSILLRMKEESDSAEPAASSIAALNLLRLAQYDGQTKWRERAEKTINAFSSQIEHFPSALPQMLGALDFSLATPRQIVIAGEGDAKETHALLAEIHAHFAPNKILILANDRSRKFLEERVEAVREMRLLDGKPTAYVCQNFTCQAPVNRPEALRELLTTNERE